MMIIIIIIIIIIVKIVIMFFDNNDIDVIIKIKFYSLKFAKLAFYNHE